MFDNMTWQLAHIGENLQVMKHRFHPCQTGPLLLFGKVVGEAKMKYLEKMKASNVGLMMMCRT